MMCNPTRGPASNNSSRSSNGGGAAQRQTTSSSDGSKGLWNKMTSAQHEQERERLVGGGSGGGGGNNNFSSDHSFHGKTRALAPLAGPGGSMVDSSRWRNVFSICLVAAACFLAGATYGERHERATRSSALRPSGALATLESKPSATSSAASSTANSAKPDQKFIVISQQRSGSRFLTSLLDTHSTIRCGNEELLQWTKNLGDKETALLDKPLSAYMEQIEQALERLPTEPTDLSPAGSPLTHVGFKIMYDQGILHYGMDLMSQLEESDIKIIHLVRKNKLLQYVSKDSNNKDKDQEGHNPHPTTEAEAAQLRNVVVDGKIKKIIKFLREKTGETKAATDLLQRYFGEGADSDALGPTGRQRYLTLYYEDLDQDNQGEMTRIFNFLGVDDERVESEYTKIHEGKKTREYFAEEDRDEVEAAIRQSRFGYMLDPNPPSNPGW